MHYITPYILEDLNKKMVFIGGPRQVGKTIHDPPNYETTKKRFIRTSCLP